MITLFISLTNKMETAVVGYIGFTINPEADHKHMELLLRLGHICFLLLLELKFLPRCRIKKIFSLNLRTLGIFTALILSALKQTSAHGTHTFAL